MAGRCDIGPKSIELYQNAISGAQTILWNGLMGVFEIEVSSKGTFAIAETVVKFCCFNHWWW